MAVPNILRNKELHYGQVPAPFDVTAVGLKWLTQENSLRQFTFLPRSSALIISREVSEKHALYLEAATTPYWLLQIYMIWPF